MSDKKDGPIDRSSIIDNLRKISIAIALLKEKNKSDKEMLINEFKLIANQVFPVFYNVFNAYFKFLDVLSKVRDLGKEQKTKDKDLNYTNWSIEKYYEYIMTDLTPYLFPY